MKKTILLLALVGVGGSARATFEMMLLPGSDGQIHLYNPENNLSLGSFRCSTTNNLIGANNLGSAVYGTNTISTYRVSDYSTGAQTAVPTLTSVGRAIELIGSSAFVMSNTSMRKFQSPSWSLSHTTFLDNSATWQSFSSYGDNLVAYGISNIGNTIVMQAINQTTGVASSLLTTATVVQAGSRLRKATAIGNSLTFIQSGAFTYLDSVGAMQIGRISLNNAGGINSVAVSSLALAGYTNANFMPALVAGHTSVYAYGQDSTTATLARLTQYDFGNGLLLNQSYTFGAPGGTFVNTTLFQHPALVLAPEPGSMIALGIGLVALARRRKRSACVPLAK